MRVLVADDDPIGRRMMATAIELLGHQVDEADDGAEALDAYKTLRPQIVVLDWMMPQLDGLAVARNIRNLDHVDVPTEDLLKDGTVPVPAHPVLVLVTAFDDPELVALALEAGIDDYLIKPVTNAEIRARVAIAVERYALRQKSDARERSLRRQRAQAEALSQARARFLANMSHELRTPLNGMVGMSDLLLNSALDDQQKEVVEIIRASAMSLDVIINDILDLTKVDEGRVTIEPRPFDVRALTDQITGLYSVRAKKLGMRLSVEVDADVCSVLVGDAVRIRQILSNLINNAFKYAKRGAVDVRLSVLDATADPPRFRFSVTDQGPGVAEEDQARLFEPFHRARLTDEPGHGLGLSICERLAELMGGSMGLESQVGRGATFWVDLPLVPADSLAEPKAIDLRIPRAPIDVLVVEDDRFNQTVARRLLERAGCRVDLADNGQVGVEKVVQARPDVVFMDVQMPVMNGLEAVRRIRASETDGRRLPIVGLTASSVVGAKELCIEAGMDAYLQKPVQLSALIEALIACLPDHYEE